MSAVPVADLLSIPALADLETPQLEWIAAHCELREFKAGETISEQGQVVDSLIFLISGTLEGTRPSEGVVYMAHAGQVTGRLPYSRLTHSSATLRAATDGRLAYFPHHQSAELLYRLPILGERLVAQMTDRVRDATRGDQQREKLESLGRLSAGLAHELNNPAAAARRAASELQGTLERWRDLEAGMRDLPPGTFEQMLELERELLSAAPAKGSPLELSDREEAWLGWLERAGVADADDVAPLLAASAVTLERLEALRSGVSAQTFALVIKRVQVSVTASRLAAEIQTSIGRVSDLVGGIKAYSYMDQGSVQAVDLNQGLEATLTVLGYKIRAKRIHIDRDLNPDLPHIEAFGGQLNQVWTNLLDNAIDALADGGTIRIGSARETASSLRITVEDDGPGIPADQQARVFEPFFTTKPVGEGTGIGLDTVRRIVAQHRGSIWLESHPGMTRFSVSLPLM